MEAALIVYKIVYAVRYQWQRYRYIVVVLGPIAPIPVQPAIECQACQA